MMKSEIEISAPPGVHNKVLEIALKLPGKTFLDVPTGYGALTERLLTAGKIVTAGDIDVQQFRGINDHSNLTLVPLDLNEASLPLQDHQYDVAVSIEGIEHLQSQWNFVRNLYRVLRPGGYLIITTPNILNFRSRIRYFMEGRYEHFKRPPIKGALEIDDMDSHHISPVSFFDLNFILESCGFLVQEIYTNTYKSRNIFSMLLKPIIKLFYLNKNYRDKKRKRGDRSELYRKVMSNEIFYGEGLILVARKN